MAGSFVIQGVIIGGFFAYGVFFKVLEAELGWSRTVLSASSSITFITMGVLAMLSGRLTDRFGPRWVLSAAGVCFGLGYVLMYYLSSPWQLFLLFGVLIGVGLGTHDVTTLTTVARWFERRRGMMTGVVKIGTACGQIIVPLVASALIIAFGWRIACAVLGLGSAFLILLAAQGLQRDPESGRRTSKGANAGSGERGLAFSEVARTRQFWTLCAAQFAFLPCVVTIPVHITAHGMDLGLAAASAASLLSVIGGCSILGRLFVGSAADRVGGRNAYFICFCVLFSSLLLLRFADASWLLFVFAAVYGFSHGGFFTVVSPTLAEFFGTTAHGAIFGMVVFFGTIGGALGPLLAGSVFDTTGSYDIAFATLAGLAFMGALLVASLRPIATPDDNRSAGGRERPATERTA